MTGARAPSQRIAIVPVVVAYLSAFPVRSAVPASRSVIRLPARCAFNRSAICSARTRPLPLSGCRPSENSAKSRFATTYALNRGPHSWARERSSQVDESTSSIRACRESSAALGMLSWRPAQAARRSDSALFGTRSSSPPTRRRNARIWARVTLSRDCAEPAIGEYLLAPWHTSLGSRCRPSRVSRSGSSESAS